ncbi:polynucleotide kinase-phosphatase [Leptolyngbya sp. AN03gr2]|uniref:polynucleotide kinase-phosphatase n=1 Tax=unclassified Leptolyngbya TaxID=2650499 RepID=UPI003D31074D
MKITIPELSLVTLIGASGSGKSTFAHKHFLPTEIISSDICRGLVSDDETNQAATQDAFDVLYYIAAKRLNRGNLTVIDATNTQAADRKHLIRLAREYHCLPVAIVLNLPEQICRDRNRQRSDRQFGDHVIRRHVQNIRQSLRTLQKEGFRQVYVLNSLEQIESVEIERQPLWNNKKHEQGPFDIIGDVHGCCDELEQLLQTLGYQLKEQTYYHPEGRKAIFLGDLVDRGDRILDTLNLVRNMVAAETALCVPGNHDYKLLRKLKGSTVKVNHGLEKTLAELEKLDGSELRSLQAFLDSLVSHYVLDGGRLVVAHAGMKQAYQGRGSATVREFALYGETTGEIDEFGLPVRYNWASDYRGDAIVVYGHTPVPEPVWFNSTIDIDTGCVFGGKLTALRYPEKEFVSVSARKVYCEPVRPLIAESSLTLQQQDDDVLDIADVTGKRIISPKLHRPITIRPENAIAALEVMSRFAVDPKWLIYLPPTMSPVETSKEPGFLEHPTEAFAYYRNQGIAQVICEEKHMGSRAIVIVCRSAEAAQKRFGVTDSRFGICYTRTGRPFFDNLQLETEFLDRLRTKLAPVWDEFQTDWIALDCELMPWSVKAQQLLRQQYAPVGRAAQVSLNDAIALLKQAQSRGIEVPLQDYQERSQLAEQYRQAYRRYCWSVQSIDDLKLAPFHILATEGSIHTDRSHLWHLEQIARIADSELVIATDHLVVDPTDPQSVQAGINWWLDLTEQGSEGMVVKPIEFLPQQRNIQPAVKCRGQEYLRIIYGAEYSRPENLERLRQRGLSAKRSLALREFALGIEALDRFVAREPLRRVHECTFGILALETEPIDPRL